MVNGSVHIVQTEDEDRLTNSFVPKLKLPTYGSPRTRSTVSARPSSSGPIITTRSKEIHSARQTLHTNSDFSHFLVSFAQTPSPPVKRRPASSSSAKRTYMRMEKEKKPPKELMSLAEDSASLLSPMIIGKIPTNLLPDTLAFAKDRRYTNSELAQHETREDTEVIEEDEQEPEFDQSSVAPMTLTPIAKTNGPTDVSPRTAYQNDNSHSEFSRRRTVADLFDVPYIQNYSPLKLKVSRSPPRNR